MTTHTLLLTNHGNEPYLLGAAIALKSDADRVCVPLYYHGYNTEHDQAQILREEFPFDCHRIFLSEPLGRILKPLLRGAQDARPFTTYVNELFKKDKYSHAGIIDIEGQLQSLLENGIPAKSLADGKDYIFYAKDLNLALNIGLPIKSIIEPTIYIFTALMSAVYETPLPPDQKELILRLSPLAEYWREIESRFAETFIPKINALSYVNFSSSQIIFTPPLSRPVKPENHPLERDSVLIVASGTGYGEDQLEKIAASIRHEYQLVTFSRNIPYAHQVTPGVFADNHLVAIISRGGWGTTWKCLIHSKPVGYIHTSFDEDPEIAHSIKTLEALKLGFEIDLSSEPFHFPKRSELDAVRENIERSVNADAEEFTIDDKEYTRDGIDFVAARIKKAL